MKRGNIEIPITEDDLKFILKNEFEQVLNLAKYNSFCSNCYGKNNIEMINYSLFLNELNDVVFQGICKSCNSRIGRYIEIGGN